MATTFRHLVLGVDGSPGARRATAFVARLRPPRGGRVTCVQVVELVRTPAMAFVPGAVRGRIAGEAASANQARLAAAQRHVDAVAARLSRSGWSARGVVRTGPPLPGLLDVVRADRPDTLVVGARGAGAVKHFLLGSVAEGALRQSPVDVLIVK